MDNALLEEIPGDRYNKYLLVPGADRELRNKIAKIKEEFFEKYEAPATRWHWPHITISKFRHLKWWEKKF